MCDRDRKRGKTKRKVKERKRVSGMRKEIGTFILKAPFLSTSPKFKCLTKLSS